MRRIGFALATFAFVQIVNSQVTLQCAQAIQDLDDMTQCVTMLRTLNPSVCSGTCEPLVTTVLITCESSRVSWCVYSICYTVS